MSKQYAAFDEVSIGASLVLSFGDQILQTSSNVNAHRLARSTFAQALYQSNVEAIFYSPNASSPSIVSAAGVPPLALGIVTSSAALTKYVGEDANGYGWCPGDGKVYSNGSVVATIGIAAPGDYIGMSVDPINGVLAFTANGQPLGSVTISTGATWFYAATVSGAPGDLAWYVISGGSPIRYPFAGASGFWQTLSSISPILLSTIPYISKSTDALANTKFNGDIDRGSNGSNAPSFPRSLWFWPFGASAPSELNGGPAQATLHILDPDNKYSRLMTDDVRDIRVPIQCLVRDSSLDAAETVFVGIIDKVTQDTDQTKSITLTDNSARLQVPLRRLLFPPNVDAAVQGKPMPMSLGPCRNYEPTLYDTTNLRYSAHDSNLSALGIQRIAGKPIVMPTDYTLLPDATGFQLVTALAGKFTAESTSTGAAYDPGGTDELAGDGDFTTITPDGNGQPTGWTCKPADNSHWQVSASGLSQETLYGNYLTVKKNGYSLANGTTYVATITVAQVPDYGPSFGDSVNGTLWVGMEASPFVVTGSSFGLTEPQGVHLPHAPITYTVTFINNSGTTQPFGFQFDCGNTDPFGGLEKLVITDVKLQALPSVGENVRLDELTLRQMIEAIYIDRGPMDASEVALSDCDVIDTATGYGYGLHLGPDDQPQVQEVGKRILDSCCSDDFVAADGIIHFAQLIAPESVNPADLDFELTVTDFNGYLLPSPDLAENLSTRLSGCPNYSPYSAGDFGSTDLTDCPLAERALLELIDQWTAVAGISLPPRYAYAHNVAALRSLFDKLAHGQAEINRVVGIYAPGRNFYAGTVFTEPGRSLELAQVGKVTYPVGNLVAGQQLMVVHVDPQPSELSTKAIFWGL